MATYYLLDQIPVRQLDDNGDPVAGALLYTYAAGTSTPQATYTDATGGTPHANPIVADGDGFWPAIWISSLGYKLVAREPDATFLWERDQVRSEAAAVLADLRDSTDGDLGAGLVGWGSGVDYTAVDTVGHKLQWLPIDVTDFTGVDPTGITDSTAGIQAAIAEAESRVTDPGIATDTGVGIRFPPGRYKVTSTLTVTKRGIGFFGDPGGRGSYIFSTIAAGILFNIGDATNATRLYFFQMADLTIGNTVLTNTSVAVKLYRTVNTKFENVLFANWYVMVDGYRASTNVMYSCWFLNQQKTTPAKAFLRLNGLDESVLTGELYTPGGGWHITDCEGIGETVSGGVEVNYTESAIEVNAVDGLYVVQLHVTGCQHAIFLNPAGTASSYVCIDVFCSQCYFDEPSQMTVDTDTMCTLQAGTVAPNIAQAGGGLVNSVYQNIRYNDCYFRGAGFVSRTSWTKVSDPAGAFFIAGRRARVFAYEGGNIQGSGFCGVQFYGNTAGEYFECHDVSLDGVTLEGNNAGGGAGIGSAITANVASLSVTGCTFGIDVGATDYVILADITDVGAGDGPASFLEMGNDFSQATAVITPVRYSPGVAAGVMISTGPSLFKGSGQWEFQQYKVTTTGNTPTTVWSAVIAPTGSSGYAFASIVGSNADGSLAQSYTFEVGFRRNGGGSALSTGTGNWAGAGIAWNPDAMAGVPTATLVGNTLTVQVTGVAATTITWCVGIWRSTSK